MDSGGYVVRYHWHITDSYGSSPVVENVGSYHVVVSGVVGGSSLVSRISYGITIYTKKKSAFRSPDVYDRDDYTYCVDPDGVVDIYHGVDWGATNSYGK